MATSLFIISLLELCDHLISRLWLRLAEEVIVRSVEESLVMVLREPVDWGTEACPCALNGSTIINILMMDVLLYKR
jgi:hypothetical protein